MAAFYARYPTSTSTNPSIGTNGAPAPTSSTEVAGINPSGNLQPLQTDASGNLNVNSATLAPGAATAANQVIELSRLSGSLVPAAFDNITLTYVVSGNGIGQIQTATYKLGATTVKTLTLTYDASNNLVTVTAA